MPCRVAEPLVRGRAYIVAVLRLGADAESNFYEGLGYKDFVQLQLLVIGSLR